MTVDATTKDFDAKHWIWGQHDTKPRFLHTMVRVQDIDAALKFYTEGFGMKVMLEKFDVPVRRVTAMFIGFGDFSDGGALELVKLWDAEGPHTHGSGYGHISIGVPDVLATLDKLEALGAEVTLRPTKLLAGAPLVAFVKDLDGYSIELIQTRRD
jgi:lactoylglutathione lyase